MQTQAALANKRPLVFGEVLLDCFPDGRQVLGGACFNVAWNLKGFGVDPVFHSAVGDDAHGQHILTAMQDWGMDTASVAKLEEWKTGTVDVSFDASGSPSYTIIEGRAWDVIPMMPSPPEPSLLYHGTMAWRSPVSRATLKQLRSTLECPVFVDINIRKPHFDVAWLPDLVHGVDWVKVNEEELAELMGEPTPDMEAVPAMAAAFCQEHQVRNILVTAGAKGAYFLADGQSTTLSPAPEPPTLVDTVGAGDAFASVTLLGLMRGTPVEQTVTQAADFAAKVCGLQGATTANKTFYTLPTS
jgi:fructokinase